MEYFGAKKFYRKKNIKYIGFFVKNFHLLDISESKEELKFVFLEFLSGFFVGL